MSALLRSPASVLWHFCRAGLWMALSSVMINSPWQADDDADNQSENGRLCSYINLSDRSARFFEFWQSGCQPYVDKPTITSARQWSPILSVTVDCLMDITTINHSGVKRHALICCNATASWLFGEKSSLPLAVGIPPTGKKLVASGAPADLSFYLRQVLRGDRSNQ